MKLNLNDAIRGAVSDVEINMILFNIEKRLIEEALQVQDACNLSGIVHSFSDGLTVLWSIANVKGHGTDWVNQHRYSRLFADKIKSLAGSIKLNDFDKIGE